MKLWTPYGKTAAAQTSEHADFGETDKTHSLMLNSDSYKHLPPHKVYEKHEREKRRKYNDRIMNVEHGTFTALIYSINGGMGGESLLFHKALANKIAMKTGDKYCNIINFIICKLSFLMQKLALLCLRGSRSLKTDCSEVPTDYDFVCLATRLNK